jgi:membrane fusion protein (multidrug efflux system)
VRPGSVPLTIELSGRTSAVQQSEVRPQVSGVILERMFTEGSTVRAGQTLYRIDPATYEATVLQAQADLASAVATAKAATARAERYGPLAEVDAVSRQEFADVQAQAAQAEARVLQAQATLKMAQISLNRTDIKAPISGRIGRSSYTAGALVTANQADVLASIYTLDPIYVDVQQSSADWLSFKQAVTRSRDRAPAAMGLTLENGTEYPQAGQIQFSEAVVNPSTGTVTWRARFANPQELLLPKMFVRGHVAQRNVAGAFRVPQAGLSRDAKGNAQVLVVGAGDKVEQLQVSTVGTSGSDWIVSGGLQPGARVIIEGTGKVRPGQEVKAVAVGTSATSVPAVQPPGA